MWIVAENGKEVNLALYEKIITVGKNVCALSMTASEASTILFTANGGSAVENERRAEEVRQYIMDELIPIGLRLNRDDVLVDVKEVLIVDDPTE